MVFLSVKIDWKCQEGCSRQEHFFTFLNGNSISCFDFYIEKKDMLGAAILCIPTEFLDFSNVKLLAKTTIPQGIPSTTIDMDLLLPF